MAARRILSRVTEAYGRMVLLDGLFQADGHPGNILVMKGESCGSCACTPLVGGPGAHGVVAGEGGQRAVCPAREHSPHVLPAPPPPGGKIGLIDYGQSKRLPDAYRRGFAELVLALNRGKDEVRGRGAWGWEWGVGSAGLAWPAPTHRTAHPPTQARAPSPLNEFAHAGDQRGPGAAGGGDRAGGRGAARQDGGGHV